MKIERFDMEQVRAMAEHMADLMHPDGANLYEQMRDLGRFKDWEQDNGLQPGDAEQLFRLANEYFAINFSADIRLLIKFRRSTFNTERGAIEFMMSLPGSTAPTMRRAAGRHHMTFVVEWKERTSV